MNEVLIPSIQTHKALDAFLETEYTYGIIMNFDLEELYEIIGKMHKNHKKAIIHLDLIRGLSGDEYGAIFCIQNLHIDGIISSRSKVISLCKKRNILGILRIFLKDQYSLAQNIKSIQESNADLVEILPYMPKILPHIKKLVTQDILMGGLITKEQHIESCIKYGATAITTSCTSLWNYRKNRKEDLT